MKKIIILTTALWVALVTGNGSSAANMYGKEISLQVFEGLSLENQHEILANAGEKDFRWLRRDEVNLPQTPLQKKIWADAKKACDAEESLWADTVLEGDVGLVGHAQPFDLELIFSTVGEIYYGYCMAIVANAVYTGDGCAFDDATEKWVGECPTGKVSVRKCFNHREADVSTESYAEFETD